MTKHTSSVSLVSPDGSATVKCSPARVEHMKAQGWTEAGEVKAEPVKKKAKKKSTSA